MVHYISGHLPFILINPIITDKAFSDYCSARHYCVPPKYPSKASFASTHPKHTTAKYPCLYISAIHHFLLGEVVLPFTFNSTYSPCHPLRATGNITSETPLSTPSRFILAPCIAPVSYTHLRAHETRHDLVCRLLLE